MSDPTLLAEIAEIVRFNAQVSPEVAIAPHSHLADDLGVDSFDMVCIIFAVRAQYSLDADPDPDSLKSVMDLAVYVDREREPRSSAA